MFQLDPDLVVLPAEALRDWRGGRRAAEGFLALLVAFRSGYDPVLAHVALVQGHDAQAQGVAHDAILYGHDGHDPVVPVHHPDHQYCRKDQTPSPLPLVKDT